MNKERKNLLVRAESLLDEAKGLIEQAQGQEQEDYDELDEDTREETAEGEALNDNIERLENASSGLDEVIAELQNITLKE